MRFLAAITLLTAISPWAGAQRMSGFSPHPGVPAAPGFMGNGFMGNGFRGKGFAGNGFGQPAFAHGNQGFPGGFAVPFFADALYSDLLSTGYPSASQPPVFVMQTPSAAVPAVAASPAPAQALIFELQGDRYVQVSGDGKSSAEMQTIDRPAATGSKPASGALVRASQKETMIATLVYRDGHHEEISDYTIANGAIYAKADYYKSGAWNRRIELSSLDLPETIQFNQSRGLNFQLPSSPNEVIVGP
ncbi:MAG TPA: hypothetical protein VHW45_02565 [Candidatus Sulfotelmatobacter sp.]|jgi:hypothetical protein|nr:hypothetical protein [Candidatus Sulfotelmatobacter sp.]